jgi:hypothetical protein
MGSLASVQAPWLVTAQPTDLLRRRRPPPAATAYSRVLPVLPLSHDCRPTVPTAARRSETTRWPRACVEKKKGNPRTTGDLVGYLFLHQKRANG